MVARNMAFAAEAMEARLLAGDSAATWNKVEIDSRRLAGGEMFFALPGSQVDGHDYVPRALAAGASAVVIERDFEPSTEGPGAWLRVDDTYRALHALTRAVRAQVPERLVAITGSAGKTTTKEMLAAMLARRFRTNRSPGNFNNLYGFPLALLGIADDCQWMVAEMGMSVPGELAEVSRLGRPDVALFTNVRPVHLENFSDLRGIAEAKAELLAGLAPGGLVVANADDPEVMGLVERHAPDGSRLLRYGFENPAEVRGFDLEPGPGGRGSRFRIAIVPEVLSDGPAEVDKALVELPIHGLYNVKNCLAAAACARAVGVPLAEIVAAMAEFRPARMRGEVVRSAGGTILIDDAYNSNPAAALEALESAHRLSARKRWAVLGDMLELGPGAPDFHRQVGQRAAELGFFVLAVGTLARFLAEGARQSGGKAESVDDAAAAAAWLRHALADDVLGEGDVVLVKGSRGIGLEVASQVLRDGGEEVA